MVNLNLNVIGGGDLFGSGSNRSRGSNFLALWNWDYDNRTVGIDAPNMDQITPTSFTLNAQNTNAVNITTDAGSQFLSIEDLSVTASLSGSGQWPTTGSVTMSLYIAAPGGDADTLPFFFTEAVSCSAAQGNISATSGSIITCQTTSSKNFIYFVSASTIHHKGNEYNPLVTFNTINDSPVSTTQTLNGNTASFNIVKDRNVPLVNVQNITASYSSSFFNDYAFNVTSSMTASIQNDATGSTTMSISIPEAGLLTSSYYFNPSSAGVKIITASFAASQNQPYNITASVIFNKGNINNPLVKVLPTGSQTSSWNNNTYPIAELDIIKDANVFISASILKTPALTSSFQYDYAFNITASLTASANWPTSQSYLYPTMSITIPEAGVSIQSYTTSSVITASFAANQFTPYTITGSAWANMIPKINSTILGVAPGAGGQQNYPAPNQLGGSGGGAGKAYEIDNFELVPNRYYSYNVGTASLVSSGLIGRQGQDISLSGFGFSGSDIVSMSLKLQGGRSGSLVGTVNVPNSYTLGGDGGSGSYVLGASTTLLTKANGGTGSWNATYGGNGAGGGGSDTNGGNPTAAGNPSIPNTKGGTGGNGLSSTILGTTYLFGAGGGGAGADTTPAEVFQGAGGTTGGGRGGNNTARFGGANGAFYGAGGGGGENAGENSGYGSNGVLLIQYEGKPKLTFSGPVVTVTTMEGVTTHYINSGSGNFIYNYEPIPDPNLGETFFAETLILGGGGAGAVDIGGGGGAGGYLLNNATYINYDNTYTINVGAGSPSYYTSPQPWGGKISGSNSFIRNNTTNLDFIGFGGGNGSGNIGGSGGGGSQFGNAGGGTTGSNQGNVGGDSGPSNYSGGGGGGGALTTGSIGNNSLSETSGMGGLGKFNLFFTASAVAGGGNGVGSGATGSLFYGGGQFGTVTGSNGLPNTGGGGGALSGTRGELNNNDSGAGGSGLVQIRYVGNPIATGGEITQGYISGSIYTLHTFRSSSQFIPISGSRPVPTY